MAQGYESTIEEVKRLWPCKEGQNPFKSNKKSELGQMGCTISHMEIIMSCPTKGVIIFEDDVKFVDGFKIKELPKMPDDGTVVFFGYMQDKDKPLQVKEGAVGGYYKMSTKEKVWCTHAYGRYVRILPCICTAR
jgi:GR25 family glycosyltransferase involved in LPS biosynthesis